MRYFAQLQLPYYLWSLSINDNSSSCSLAYDRSFTLLSLRHPVFLARPLSLRNHNVLFRSFVDAIASDHCARLFQDRYIQLPYKNYPKKGRRVENFDLMDAYQ